MGREIVIYVALYGAFTKENMLNLLLLIIVMRKGKKTILLHANHHIFQQQFRDAKYKIGFWSYSKCVMRALSEDKFADIVFVLKLIYHEQ